MLFFLGRKKTSKGTRVEFLCVSSCSSRVDDKFRQFSAGADMSTIHKTCIKMNHWVAIWNLYYKSSQASFDLLGPATALKGFLIQIWWNNCPGLRERFTGSLCWPYRGWRIHVGGFPEKSKKYLYIIDTFVSTALKAATSKMSKGSMAFNWSTTRFYFQSILKQVACLKCMAAHPRFEVNTLGSPSGYWDDETSLCPAPHQCQTSPHCSEEPMLHQQGM